MVPNAVILVKRSSAVWRTSALRKIDRLQVHAGISNATDITFGGAASGKGFGEFFTVGRIRHGDDIGTFGHGLRQKTSHQRVLGLGWGSFALARGRTLGRIPGEVEWNTRRG